MTGSDSCAYAVSAGGALHNATANAIKIAKVFVKIFLPFIVRPLFIAGEIAYLIPISFVTCFFVE